MFIKLRKLLIPPEYVNSSAEGKGAGLSLAAHLPVCSTSHWSINKEKEYILILAPTL